MTYAQCTIFLSLTYASFETIRTAVYATGNITKFMIWPEAIYLLVLPISYYAGISTPAHPSKSSLTTTFAFPSTSTSSPSRPARTQTHGRYIYPHPAWRPRSTASDWFRHAAPYTG